MIAMMPLLTGCLMEYPEMTADGELGEDPTSVRVNVEISAGLGLGDEIPDYSDEDAVWMHRITVAAYDASNRFLEKRETVYEELSDDGTLSVDVDFRLHAKEYRLVVWADLVSETENGIYYKTDDLTRIRHERFRGQTIYKDALYASENLDLSVYGDEWNAEVDFAVELARPMGVYELVANDVRKFVAGLDDNPDIGETFVVRVNYDGYLPTGFNAYDGITWNALNLQTFSRTVRVPSGNEDELSLVFDYVLMDEDNENVSLTVDILDDRNNIAASSTITVPCRRNERTVIRRPFLTSQPGDGVSIDTDFETGEDVDLGII